MSRTLPPSSAQGLTLRASGWLWVLAEWAALVTAAAGMACISVLASVTPPVLPRMVATFILCGGVLIAALYATSGSMMRQRVPRRTAVALVIALFASLAALIVSERVAEAQFSLLALLSVLCLIEASQREPRQRLLVAVQYAVLCGLLAAALGALSDATGIGWSTRIGIHGHPVGVRYLGLETGLAAALSVVLVHRFRRPLSTVFMLALQVGAGAVVAVSVPIQWAWLLPYAMVGVGAALVVLWAPPLVARRAPLSRRTFAVAAAVAACIGALWMYRHVQSGPATDDGTTTGNILFYSRGGLDWETASYEATKSWDGGMFGELPSYLAADGHSVEFADGYDELADRLSHADVLVLINCDQVWTPEQRANLSTYLASGGRLLVLGDHTDVFGLMVGSNSLLQEYGIEFEFDSAYYSRRSWDCCARAVGGSLYDSMEFPLVHAVGASLRLSGAARPLVVGRHAFSDIGIRENVMGSYLGTYALEEGEPYGDVVLVASSLDSRVIVYGDTSAFQNGALAYSWSKHVRPLFRSMTSDTRLAPHGWAEVVLIVLVVLLVLVSDLRLVALLLFGALAGTFLGNVLRESTQLRLQNDHALIDVSSAGLVGHYDARFNAIGPLVLHLTRNGLLPVISHTELPLGEAGAGPALVVLVAPMAIPDAQRSEELSAYVRAGGRLLVVGGGDSAVAHLLEPFRLRPGSLLGECPPVRGGDPDPFVPRFRRAWSIEGPEDAIRLCEVGGFVTAASVSYGEGEIVWIADSLYFSIPNVEGLWGSHQGNMRWIRGLLERLLGRESEALPEMWPSPQKPG